MAEQGAASERAPADEACVRFNSVAYLATCVEDAGVWLRQWYPMISHTSDFLVQVGKYAPSKEKEKGDCPAPILRVATTCRGAGSALSNAALCLKGAAGVCNILAAGLKCINHAEGIRAGLDAASRPTLILIKSLPQLEEVLERSRSTGSPILLDVSPEVTIAFAHRIYRHLEKRGESFVGLIKDGQNMKLRIAQRSRLMALLRQHPLPTGLADVLAADDAPPA